jgi:anti-sigma factor RsiW
VVVVSENCIDPAEIQIGDLVAYADGTAGEPVAQHVARCPACARQVEEFAELQAVLSATLYRHTCPEPDQLIAYHQDELTGNEKLVVAQHARQCPHCARELAGLAREERAGLFGRVRDRIERLVATLTTPAPSAAPVRDGAGALRPKQQVHQAGEMDVIVSLEPAAGEPGLWDVSGLVHVGGEVPETIGGSRVELYRGKGLIAITTVSRRGHFAFSQLEPGSFDLALLWEGREVRLEGVVVE